MKILVDMGSGRIIGIKEVNIPVLTQLASTTLECIDEFGMGELIKPKLNVIFSKEYKTTRLTLEYDDKINSSVLIYDREEYHTTTRNRIQSAIINLLTIQKEK